MMSSSLLSILSILSSLVLLPITTTLADTVELAECPKEPNVFGVYVNNGKHCVRERNEIARDIVTATCKNGWELQEEPPKAYCKATTAEYNKQDSFPICPLDYKRYANQCHSPCPRGYNAKRGKCIQLKDTLPQHSMTCAASKHRIGAYCCETDQCGDLVQKQQENRIKKQQQKQQTIRGGGSSSLSVVPPPPSSSSLKECNLPEVPGRFYYNQLTGNCDRSRISEPRVWTKLPRDNKNRYIGTCADDETKVLGGCQPKCPLHFKAQKGMCHLPSCSVPFGSGILQEEDSRISNNIVLCPEGKYYLASKTM